MNDLIEAIKQLKKEKNAIILGHYYQKGPITSAIVWHWLNGQPKRKRISL